MNSRLRLLHISLFVIMAMATTGVRANGKRPLKITTIINEPFMKYRDQSLKGNERFEGFLVDLLAELKNEIGFDYEIYVVPDNKYGSLLDGSWNGMIVEVINKRADIAAADLTITEVRKNYVDFTVPYMTSGVGILMKKSEPPATNPYFFIKAFSAQVWLCILFAFVGVTVFLFILGRFSASECISTDSTSRGNNLNASNAIYFVIASLFMQNSKVAPRGAAPRVLSCVWWIFSFFVLACYVANLTAILVYRMDVEPASTAISDVESLAQQTTVKYGTLRAGSTHALFEKSKLPLYQHMSNVMRNTKPSPFVSSYEEGIQRVREGNYAFFMEATSISYQVARDCSLMQVGGLLDTKGYGLVLNYGNNLTQILSSKILGLQETGVLQGMREKWWGNVNADACEEAEIAELGVSLSMTSIRGVFHFLLIGIIATLLIAIFELCYKARLNSKQGGGSLCSEVLKESKYAMCGGGPHRNVGDKRNGGPDDRISLERHDAV